MISIYQIGNFRVHLVPSSLQGETHDLATRFRTSTQELSGVSGHVVSEYIGRPVVEAGSWKVEGTLVCGATQTCESVDQQFNRMIANGGTLVPIIGVLPPEYCYCTYCKHSPCTCSTTPEAMWLLTHGVITDYKSSYKRGLNANNANGAIAVSMTIEGPTHWEPLNDIDWRFWGRNLPEYTDTTSSVAKYTHPRLPRWGGRADSGFQRIIGDGSFWYSPANWIRAYTPAFNRRARAVLTSSNPATPTVTITPSSSYDHVVDVPFENWPAQPKSLYYFYFSGGLPSSGTIGITVTTTTPTGDKHKLLTYLSLADYYSYFTSPYYPTTLFVGVMGNKIISSSYDVPRYTPWAYRGAYPGETLVGYNEVSMYITGTGLSAAVAAVHIFRRY